MQYDAVQNRLFPINVLAGIIGDLIGSYLLLLRLTERNYLFFLQQVLGQLFEDEWISASAQQDATGQCTCNRRENQSITAEMFVTT